MTRTRFEVTLGQWHMDIDTLLKNYTKRVPFVYVRLELKFQPGHFLPRWLFLQS